MRIQFFPGSTHFPMFFPNKVVIKRNAVFSVVIPRKRAKIRQDSSVHEEGDAGKFINVV